MPNIELLAYCPMYMKDFLYFCINGAPDGHGGWLPDEHGRPRTGVFDWLYGRLVPEAHFYTSSPTDPVQLFAATIHRLEPLPIPWFLNIPGFNDLLVPDGVVGAASNFPALGQPLANLISRPDLDEEFIARRDNVERVLTSLRHEASGTLPFSAESFRAALRGERGTDLSTMVVEIRNKLGIQLR